jgi:transposase
MSRKQYRAWTPDQVYLLPPSPREWLPESHLVHFVMDVVAELDIGAIDRVYQQKDHRGERPWDPRMMVSLLVYGYCIGVRSSRRLEKATYEDVAFRLLSGNTQPDHTAISEFRRVHLAALSGLFLQVLQLCQKAGMVKLGRVALDGTKVKANASKHKAMSYAYMQRAEQELQAEIDTMLAEAAAADTQEDAVHGKERTGDELPKELRQRQDRLARIQAAKTALEADAKAARDAVLAEREQAKNPPDEPPAPSLPTHQVRHDAAGAPKPDTQRNFTDPESKIMKSGKDFVQAYNAQIVVDEAHQIIVAEAVTNQAPDAQHFAAMMEATESNCGARAVQTLGDAGYYSAENIDYCETRGMDALISVSREKHVLDDGQPIPDGDPRADMRKKLRGSLGKPAYARRKVIVEPVFGHIKSARGLRQFLMRGLEKVRGEWTLDCLCHNMLKLFRFGRMSALA